ncbi:protein argonaute-2 [Clonorchis sinensis]|uniref:Protein argonaute-2 n=1 Tax=Clonorchis sinensis TaxID=79923 RepID=G7Y446_CLOSI|nr:protein argonaute-2 [Clonorchis sinensis]
MQRGRGRGGYSDRGRGGYDDQGRGGRGSYGPPRGAPRMSAGLDQYGDDRQRFSSGPRGRGHAWRPRGDIGGERQPSFGLDDFPPPMSGEKLVGQSRETSSERLSMQRSIRIPSRPDKGGSSGQRCEVIANCWDLNLLSKSVLMYFIETVAVYRLDKEKKKVELNLPPKEKRALLQQVVNSLHREVIYDGGHAVYSEKPIPGVTKDGVTRQMNITDPLNRDELLLDYRIMEVQTVHTSDVANFITNSKATSLDMPQVIFKLVLTFPQDSIRLLDCILKTICKGSFESFGRAALFYTDPVKVVHDKLFSIHKGFITSVRPQWKVRVNIDMTCKAFFTSGNLADVMYEKYGDGIVNCSRQMAMDLRRIRVETIPFYKNDAGDKYSRRFTVHGLSSESAATLMIPDVNQTVADYFDKHHNIRLKYPELPCVKVNLSRDVFLPMELLNIIPYQAPNAKKSEIASEVIRCAAIRPEERFRELDTFVREIIKSSHPLVKEFGIQVDPRPQKIPARVLDTPSASFGRQQSQLGRGKWMAPAFFHPASAEGVIDWAILSLPGDRNAQRHQQMLATQLPSTAQRFNVKMNRPECAIIQRADLQHQFQQLISRGIHFILLVLYDDLNYPTIKRLGDLQTGMRTQCVRGRTLDKPNVIPNLLLKINGKLGGINWQILDVMKNDELVMVFGADVTHPAPTQTQQVRQSIAAVLGSVTPDLMRYAVVVRQQATTEKGNKTTREIIDSMDSIVGELLKAFCRNTNGRFPTRLIFYRDGVSEGQFENVLVEELASIQRACTALRPDYEPAITYIVVQKRHHIRFRPTNPRQRNVDPGTVVDTHVTHAREFDFYLCSQEGIQGTSKPAHYHVLYDDSNWTSDALQRFTFFLCHAYMRCPRSVSYPAPTYYAHLAAFRARSAECRRWAGPNGFSSVNNKAKLELLQQQFNKAHTATQFTSEGETDNFFHFLDVDLGRRHLGILRRLVYGKPIWSGQYINFISFVPLKQKQNLIYSLTNKEKKICPDDALEQEILTLSNFLRDNGFPDKLIIKLLNRGEANTVTATVGRKPLYIGLPFKGNIPADLLNRKLFTSLSKVYPAATLRTWFTSNRLCSLNLKDRVPIHAQNIVTIVSIPTRTTQYVWNLDQHKYQGTGQNRTTVIYLQIPETNQTGNLTTNVIGISGRKPNIQPELKNYRKPYSVPIRRMMGSVSNRYWKQLDSKIG